VNDDLRRFWKFVEFVCVKLFYQFSPQRKPRNCLRRTSLFVELEPNPDTIEYGIEVRIVL